MSGSSPWVVKTLGRGKSLCRCVTGETVRKLSIEIAIPATVGVPSAHQARIALQYRNRRVH